MVVYGSYSFEVTVNYLRACNEVFEALPKTNRVIDGKPGSYIAVGVVMSSANPSCVDPDQTETKTFSVLAAKDLRFEKILEKNNGATFSPAFIESVTQAEPLGGKIQVPYTGMHGCSETSYVGNHIIFPLKSGNGRYGFLAIAEDLGNQCSNPPSRFWDYFEVPEIPGGYSFVPVE